MEHLRTRLTFVCRRSTASRSRWWKRELRLAGRNASFFCICPMLCAKNENKSCSIVWLSFEVSLENSPWALYVWAMIALKHLVVVLDGIRLQLVSSRLTGSRTTI